MYPNFYFSGKYAKSDGVLINMDSTRAGTSKHYSGLNLNLGCGKSVISGAVGIDVEPSVEPDIVLDFVRNRLPYEDNTVDRVFLFHTIEHIPESLHHGLYREIWRVLKPDGFFYLSYPEFRKCAENYIRNHQGKRAFWKATIYGRQLYPSDFHVALMDTETLIIDLDIMGFVVEWRRPETGEDYNTILKCRKVERAMDYEDVLKREIFGIMEEEDANDNRESGR